MQFFKRTSITVHIFNDKYRCYYDDNKNDLLRLTKTITKEQNIKGNLVVSFNLVSAAKMLELNKTYRNIDKSTDVLSFPQGELFKGTYDLGDIFINAPLIKEQATAIASDINTEIKFLFMHGLLHLVGYNHLNKQDEQLMVNKQREIFKKLGIRDD